MSLVKNLIKDYAAVVRDLLSTKETEMTKKPRAKIASEEEIRLLAYLKWETSQPTNKPSEEFWVEAEQELNGVKKTETEEK